MIFPKMIRGGKEHHNINIGSSSARFWPRHIGEKRRVLILPIRQISTNLYNSQMITEITVGVLALQGAIYEHVNLLRQASNQLQKGITIKWHFIEVRTSDQLVRCDALVIPGGESTTVSLVAARSNLLDPLRDFVK